MDGIKTHKHTAYVDDDDRLYSRQLLGRLIDGWRWLGAYRRQIRIHRAKHMLSIQHIVCSFIHQGRHDVSTRRRPLVTRTANNLLTIFHFTHHRLYKLYIHGVVIRFIVVVIGAPWIELLLYNWCPCPCSSCCYRSTTAVFFFG